MTAERALHEELAVIGDGALPAGAACFPLDTERSPEDLLADLKARLAERRAEVDTDPFANPILLLSLEVKRRLESGAWSYSAVEQLVQRLTVDAFDGRSQRLGAYLGECDPEANEARIRDAVEGLTRTAGGEDVPFEAFRSRIERELFGMVITAHPTFGIDPVLMRIMAELAGGRDAEGRPLDAGGRADRLRQAARLEHRPAKGLDLKQELVIANEAIGHIHDALARMRRIVLEVAAERYPDRWHALSPVLITLASWVGFDLDGRSDISWANIVATALRNQIAQFGRYRRSFEALRGAAGRHAALGHVIDLILARFTLAERDAADALAVFDASSADLALLQRQAQAMHASQDGRLVHAKPLIELIDGALDLEPPQDLAIALVGLRAELAGLGLALAHVHTRINAQQLYNAVRKQIGMTTPPDDPSRKWTYLRQIEGLIEQAEPAAINFGSIIDEETSAKRLFMLIAQMLKYVDADRPIRFLIAECETPFTLLTALYYAKVFGVDDRIDISPLFETGKALATGHVVIADALSSPAFAAYVRRRGRLAIQMGYSDAGRYLGQTAAAFMLERLRLRVGALLLERGLGDVELVIFDTHGDSIGRGGHPRSFADRLAYVDTAESRARFAESRLRCKQEVSFQGGDGYLYFMSETTAFAAVTRILEHSLAPAAPTDDPFYDETVYVEEFFSRVAQFNQALMANSDFAALLGAYGANLVYPSGSRALRREHESLSARVDLESATQLRAIPQNAILQQLGCLANSIGGVGEAVSADPERFQRLYHDSARFRRVMNMIEYAFMFTDLDVLKAYVDLFDAGLWQARAARRIERERADELIEVARVVEAEGLHERLVRVMRRLRYDHRELALALREHRRRRREEGADPIAVSPEARDNMHMLHALRLGLIQNLLLLAVHLPDFSSRHDINRDGLIHRLIHLDVPSVLGRLSDIFPVQETRVADGDFGEVATYRGDASQGYAHEHATLFRPMGGLHELIRRIGSGVIHNIGALG
ncbi:phosphoenolpyruvate carboxylase [Marinivivus vitaminiproducens]|uniref:phosphoenolpyruvate carboxylase n=1 Tax=Marinivivus vitaminiproducens TaxID=3035935 RepID=UPI002799D95E|nr:phosphoenolpyruvate carboxylase [Geminicoccaceae bacterium SCSIO 64248]